MRGRFSRYSHYTPHFTVMATVLLAVMLSSAYAQPLEVTARFSPWPPEGWPEGAQGEVRAEAIVEEGEGEDSAYETVFRFPISEDGQVTYRFPERLPRRARRLYAPVRLENYVSCEGITSVMSPPDATIVVLRLNIYADEVWWGYVSIGVTETDLFSIDIKQVFGIAYARSPFTLNASGRCEDTGILDVTALDMREGPNILQVEDDGETSLLHTVEALNLPQEAVGFGE